MQGGKRFSRIAWAAIPTSSSLGFLRPSNKVCGNSAHASLICNCQMSLWHRLKMREKFFLLFSMLFLSISFFSCSDDEPGIDDPNNEDYAEVIRIVNMDDYWDYILFQDEDHVSCIKETDGILNAWGVFNENTLHLTTDENNRITDIEVPNLKVNIRYKADRAFISGTANNTIFCDSITISQPEIQSRANNSLSWTDVLGWAADKGIGAAADKVFDGIPFKDLVDFIHDLDDRNTYEQLDYITDCMENWQGEVLEKLKLLPADWWKKFLEDIKNKDGESKIGPTIIIGLLTGNAPYIYTTSATCLVDGVLEAYANDSEFNFTYGICYSKNENPTIEDMKSSTNVTSGMISSIKVSLPQKFVLSNLEESTKYYYRAFYKDNITGYVAYSNLRSFETSNIPANISNFVQTNAYYNNSGYSFDSATFNYQYKTAIKFELKSFDDISDWGYYYVNHNGNRVAFSLMNRNQLRCDEEFTYYDNSSSVKLYMGCYVKYKSVGDKVFYSDPQEFELNYSEDIELTFKNSQYIEVTHDDSLGYYRCGVTFDAYFSIKGAERLTSLTILPYGNFLSWTCQTYTDPRDGDFKTRITNQYIYEYGLYGNFYCYIVAKDVDGKEYYSDNIIRMYHDGYHFTNCVVESYDNLTNTSKSNKRTNKVRLIPKH